MNKELIEKCLSLIYTDMLMLKDGEWIPDEHSAEATIDNIEILAQELKIPLKDLRDE